MCLLPYPLPSITFSSLKSKSESIFVFVFIFFGVCDMQVVLYSVILPSLNSFCCLWRKEGLSVRFYINMLTLKQCYEGYVPTATWTTRLNGKPCSTLVICFWLGLIIPSWSKSMEQIPCWEADSRLVNSLPFMEPKGLLVC
jgi:hypothetical protein